MSDSGRGPSFLVCANVMSLDETLTVFHSKQLAEVKLAALNPALIIAILVTAWSWSSQNYTFPSLNLQSECYMYS